MEEPKRKRVTVKLKNPNPLFDKWLTEWRDKAKAADSKMQHTFSIALKSLRKYPLPLESGKDCKILTGFGDKLCTMLDEKLARYKADGGTIDIATDIRSPRNTEYVPQKGSGAFAILVTLYEASEVPGYPGFMTKSEIIAKGQDLSNTSFTKPAPDTRYTAWSSMSTLIKKQLVIKESNPAKFRLTEAGSDLGEKLYIQQKIDEFNNLENAPSTSQSVALSPKKQQPIWRGHSSASSSSQSSVSFEQVILAPNSFEILLLVDTAEVNGGKSQLDPILIELKRLGVCHEVRNLKVGDYVWICRHISTKVELVLPYIIERKRMDDLGQSIKDGRFHEQKFRLKQCGLKNRIYLVESYGKNEHYGLPIPTLHQAATNTLVQDGFLVKFTDSGQESCEYLAGLTTFLSRMFGCKTLMSCMKQDLQDSAVDDDLIPLMYFQEFNKSSSKTRHFTVREMFVKQLLQISGIAVDKALAITGQYPTPMLLKNAYSKIDGNQGEKLLAGIRYGNLDRKIGPVLSKVIYQLFCERNYT